MSVSRGNKRYWDEDQEIFEDHLDAKTLKEYEQRELEEVINRYGRYPATAEKSTNYGRKDHGGPPVLALNGPKSISRGVKRLVQSEHLLPVPIPNFPVPKRIDPPDGFRGTADQLPRAPGPWMTAIGDGFDQPEPDSKDYGFWLRWTESLPYRWESMRTDEVVIPGYPNKLELYRASRSMKGWKWWLVHFVTLPGVAEADMRVYVEPFTKPSTVHFSERGIFSNFSVQPRRASATLLKGLEAGAELRWQGIPISDFERRQDRAKLRDKIWVEGIRDHYGFLGQAICNASAEMKSSVKVLFLMIMTIWTVLFSFGPISLAGILSEVLVGIIPAQNALSGILAMKADHELRDTRKEVAWTVGGNARQWLVYFPFYEGTSMLVGWIYISRPSWYWWALAWRTVVLVACGSPYFGAFRYHRPSLREQKIRISELCNMVITPENRSDSSSRGRLTSAAKAIWLERGKKRQNAVILRPSLREQKIKANFLKMVMAGEKGDPEKGNKVEFTIENRAKDLKTKASQMLGFLEEYSQVVDKNGNYNKKSGTSTADSLKAALKKLDEEMEAMKSATKTEQALWEEEKAAKEAGEEWFPPKRKMKDKFKAHKDVETALNELEGLILRAHGMMRTTPGGYGMELMLKDRYGATDAEVTEYLNAFNEEVGSRLSRENGIDAAFQHKALRSGWQSNEFYGTLGAEEEPELNQLPWEQEYDHSKLPGKYSALPDVTESAKEFQRTGEGMWSDVNVRRAWQDELRAAAPSLWTDEFAQEQAKTTRDSPWDSRYIARAAENILEDPVADAREAKNTYFQRRPKGPMFPTRRWNVAADY